MTLKELKPGQSAIVRAVGGEGALRQHFLDMGVIPGAALTLIKFAPMGDPMELHIHDYELSFRLADADKIQVELLDDKIHDDLTGIYFQDVDATHPGLGEGGKFHAKNDNENALPKGSKLTFALAGNQNCGKTTLFNQLTGSNQHVGNFPGVTVDQKSGQIRNHSNTLVTDLPGIYSLSPYTAEEIVSREFILNEKPTCIIDIADATNIERNLYLTLQLMELDVPVVLALNMMDEVRGNGGTIRINKMEKLLGIPVVPISASKNEGVTELIEHAVHIAEYQEKPSRIDFCSADHKGGAVHRCLHGIMHLVEDHAKEAGVPIRFAASKLAEGEPEMAKRLNLTKNECEMIEHIIQQMEEESGMDRSAAIADMRFSFIHALCDLTVVRPQESKERILSEKIDKVLTGKYTAIPAFILIMGLVFYLTFHVIGAALQQLLERGITSLSHIVDAGMTSLNVNAGLHSLVINGLFNGVGSVVSFIPIIIILFFFLSMLEDSGYLARVTFVMDKLLRKIGLSGRSIVPMLIGFGCTVPGVMASRTLPSERDRKLTILLTPFMSCTAKLPVYGFIANAFFPKYAGLIMVGLYFLGILMSILVAFLFKGTIFKGEAVPFVMELPNYRFPGFKNVAHLLWEKAKDFLTRAFTVILLATIVIWFFETFDSHLNMVTDQQNSMLAGFAGLIAPVFQLHGFADWRIVVALISGFLAKESVVSTLSVLLGSTTTILSILTPAAALALLVFSLLYAPCVAAVASIRRELGRGWALEVVVFQCVIAWIVSLLVYSIAVLI